jgi:hypothetical protein
MPSLSCPSCQRENAPGAAFCNGCGARLARVCSSCNRSNAPDAGFCNEDVGRAVEGQFPSSEPRDLELKGFSGTHPGYPIAWVEDRG